MITEVISSRIQFSANLICYDPWVHITVVAGPLLFFSSAGSSDNKSEGVKHNMKRTIYLWLSGAILAGLMAPLVAAQSQNDSLGEYARQLKKKKQTGTVTKTKYDSDNLPSSGTVNVVGAAPEDRDRTHNGHQPETNVQDNAKTDTTPGQSAEEREKVYANWNKQIADQKQKVDQLQLELNQFLQQNQGVPIAQYKPQADAKQQALDSAKQQLADLQERARKAGVPSKLRE